MANPNYPQSPVAIEIRQVANGFLVTRSHNFARGGEDTIDTSQVYQTMASLVDFLRKHFTHRASAVLTDDVNTSTPYVVNPDTTVIR